MTPLIQVHAVDLMLCKPDWELREARRNNCLNLAARELDISSSSTSTSTSHWNTRDIRHWLYTVPIYNNSFFFLNTEIFTY